MAQLWRNRCWFIHLLSIHRFPISLLCLFPPSPPPVGPGHQPSPAILFATSGEAALAWRGLGPGDQSCVSPPTLPCHVTTCPAHVSLVFLLIWPPRLPPPALTQQFGDLTDIWCRCSGKSRVTISTLAATISTISTAETLLIFAEMK